MLIAIMLPNFAKIGIIIDFKINQDFISKVLCINKNEPVKKCNGKCYLSKQLKKADEQEEKQTPKSKKEYFEIIFFDTKKPSIILGYLNWNSTRTKSHYKNIFVNPSFITDIFHPPKPHFINTI